MKVEGATLSTEQKDAIVKSVKDKVEALKTDIQAGKEGVVPQFPMDVAVPFVGLFLASQFAENVVMDDDYVELAFSMKHLNMLTERQLKLLKPVEGGFYLEQNEKGDKALGQMLIDDNFFNSLFSVFLSIDKMFSVRDIAKGHKQAEPFMQAMTTTNIGAIFPQFTEEYGSGKKLDLVFTPSHEFFLDGFPNAKMSGIYMDKNGNWKVMLNIALQINVETFPQVWDPVRNIFMTMVFKMKTTQVETNGQKFLKFIPKNFELTQIKVNKGDQPMEMEQMMLQSMANIQLEQTKKLLKPYQVDVTDLDKKGPAELQCFGFDLADIDLSFKKSQMQLGLYYKDTETPDADVCNHFFKQLGESPQKIMDQIKRASAKAEEEMRKMKDGSVKKVEDGKKKAIHDEL